MDHSALHQRAREKGVQPIIYWIVRAVLQPFFHLYFRLSRIGLEHVPTDGPYIVAANHRSFLDPFIIAVIARRPLYYVAKRELFEKRWQGWLLNALGAFPVDRGAGDQEMLTTARAILARGDSVLMFPEGTRIRPGALGRPRRGVGRLALEAGVPVVPVAVIGTEAIRRGWRIRPHKVRMRVGKPLTFPHVEQPSRELAAAVTDRIWPCVMLQWEWLGGLPPLRHATVLGRDDHGVAAALASAGIAIGPAVAAADHAVVFSGALPSADELERLGTTRVAHVTGSGVGGVVIISAADRCLGRQLRDAFAAVGREATVERVAA
jgi:1-acyl-sn-glycerol-3-phosphate acyltransferase